MKGLYSVLCGVQPVRVVYGDGQVLYLPPFTTVEEVLQSYPHHFVCQPGLSSYSGGRSNQMLSMDTDLESGCIYFLLPLPRLFPTSSSPPQSCTCFSQSHDDESSSRRSPDNKMVPCTSPLRIYSSPQRFGGLGSPFRSQKCLKSFLTGSKSKVLPESNLYSGGRGDVTVSSVSRAKICPWRPRLGCISEEDDLEMALEELKYHGMRYRREAYAAGKVVPKHPLSPRPAKLTSASLARAMNRSAMGSPNMVMS